MARVLNEQFIRMQKLAGVITEGEYKMKMEAAADMSPEEAAQEAVAQVSKLQNSSEMDELAAKIASDPNLMKQFEKALTKGGISIDESTDSLDKGDLKTLALNFAKVGSSVSEATYTHHGDSGAVAGGLLSFVGGGILGKLLLGAVTAAVPVFGAPALLGGLLGVGLWVLGKKIYDKVSGKEERMARFMQDIEDIESGKLKPLEKVSSRTIRRPGEFGDLA